MRVYVPCSPSHRPLLDGWLAPSLCADFQLEVVEMAQLSATGRFDEPGFQPVVRAKAALLRDLAAVPGPPCLLADADIQLFGLRPERLRALLGACDLAFQRDEAAGRVNTGFVVVRPGAAVTALAARVLEQIDRRSEHDQREFNRALGLRDTGRWQRRWNRWISRHPIAGRTPQWHTLRRSGESRPEGVRWRYLPSSFYTPGLSRLAVWRPGDPVRPPRDIEMHHANWTLGIANKISQLEAVRRAVLAARSRWLPR
jgi:hypothetical protein